MSDHTPRPTRPEPKPYQPPGSIGLDFLTALMYGVLGVVAFGGMLAITMFNAHPFGCGDACMALRAGRIVAMFSLGIGVSVAICGPLLWKERFCPMFCWPLLGAIVVFLGVLVGLSIANPTG